MRRGLTALTVLLAMARPALAQQPQPLPIAVADLRLFTSKIGQDATTATDLGVGATNVPGRANGFALGGTVYLYRGRSVSMGVGGEVVFGRARSSIVDATGATPPVQVQTYLTSSSGQISANFGHRQGWSYVSMGFGPMRVESYLGDVAPPNAPPGRLTPNFGGGARWFPTGHIAFCFDVRIYSTQRVASTPLYAGRDRKNMMVLSAGIAIK